MRSLLVFIFIAISTFNLHAQFSWAEIGVDGLTCSACTRSVEMQIRKLDFVDSVNMNLEHTDGKIYFKKGATVNIEKIAQAVVDAGFSVRFLQAGFEFKNQQVSENSCYSFENNTYQFLGVDSKTLNGEVVMKFIGKKYLPEKDLSKWKPKMKSSCGDKSGKVYFVTL
jgi:copper chaperone CopZ